MNANSNFRTFPVADAPASVATFRAVRLVSFIALLSFSAVIAQAQTNWQTVGSGDFSSPANWTGGVPTSLLDAVINNGTSGSPTFANLNGAANVRNLTLGSFNTLALGNAAHLSIFGSSFANSGAVTITAGANPTYFGLQNDVTLTGTGKITLSTTGAGSAIIRQDATGHTLTNQTNTIQGTGIIGGGFLALVNASGGTINANATGQALALNSSATIGVTNQGLLEATNGGILAIQTGVDNAGGQITANGGTVTIDSTINGGTLTSTGGGVLGTAVSGTSTLNGVTLSSGSTFTGGNSAKIFVSGTTTNSGVIQVSAGANNSLLGLNTDSTLSGGGQVTLSTTGGGVAIIQQQTGGLTLTNHDNSIQGAGIVGNGGLTFVNEAGGTVNASASGQTLALNGLGGVTNLGLLKATSSGTLALQANVENSGGQITADGGNVAISSTINGGTLTSVNGGLLGTAAGTTAALNGVTLSSGSTFVNGNASNVFVSGNTTNHGVIQVAAGGNHTRLGLTSDTTLSGGGQVNLSMSGGGIAYIQQQVGALTLTNHDNAIQGAGILGNGGLTFINEAGGTVDANASGQTFTLNGSGVTNQGLMKATNGGTLALQANVANAGGQITANGGTVSIGSTINGGTLTSTGGGTLGTSSGGTAVLNSVTLTSGTTYWNGNASNLFVTGTITNPGAIQVAAGANHTYFGLNSDTTLIGGGQVNLSMSGGGLAILQQQTGGLTLTNQDNTIQGAGVIGNNGLTLINNINGTINASASGQTLKLTGTGGVTNQGLMEATAGGTLSIINTTVNNSGGNISSSGGGVVVVGGSSTIKAGTLSGTFQTPSADIAVLDGSTPITLSSGSTYSVGNGADLFVQGTIVNHGSISVGAGANHTYFGLNSNTTLEGGGQLNLSMSGGGFAIIQQQTGGLTLTNQDNTIQGAGFIGNGGLSLVNGAAGTILANAPGQTLQLNGSGGLTNNGTFEVNPASTLLVQYPSLSNFSGNTLTGGSYIVNGTAGNTGPMQINAFGNNVAGEVVNNAATIVLNGPNANTLFVDAGGHAALAPLAANLAAGSFTVNGGYSFTAVGDLSNAGTVHVGGNGSALTVGAAKTYTQSAGTTLIDSGGTLGAGTAHIAGGSVQLAGGTLNASTLNNDASGLITGFGNLNVRPTNAGTIRADGGTLALSNGIQASGSASHVETVAGGTLDVSAGASASGAAFLANNGSLNVGTKTFTVDKDYTNAHFGTGNSFDARANVIGSGAINASGDTTQAITGTGVTGGTTTAATLALGNLREGQSITQTYNVANTGSSGPALRGAIQTTVNGANITDTRLSGTGVTAGNFGPLATGDSQSLSVTFTGTSAGALTGQKVAVANNFTNIADQTVTFTGGVYRAAQANTITPNPVNLGNVRVGDTLATNLGITNVATDSGGYTETLGATVTGSTGGVTTSGSVSGLAFGASSNAISAGFNTSTVGTKNGTATIGFTSTEVGGSGLGTIGVGSQTVTLNGAVYRLADGSVAPNPIVINAREGTVVSSAVTVSNVAAADGYSEGLRASASSSTGAAGISGNTGLIAAGASGGGLSVSLDTSSAGAKSGTATVHYVSDGLGTSGLSQIAAGDDTISVTGGVYRAAQANTIAPNPVNLGNVHVGDALGTTLGITNVAAASGGYTETLGATVTGSSGGVTTGGSVSGLAAGANSNAISANFNTTTAGAKSGTATIGFTSTEVGGSGLGTIGVGSQTVSLNGGVYRLAGATLGDVSFGNVLVGSNQTRYVSVSNSALADLFSEGLDASLGGFSGSSAGLLSGLGSITNLAAGSTDNTTLAITLNTSSSGAVSANVQVLLASNGATTSGLGLTALPSQLVPISGSIGGVVGNLASASAAAPNPVNLGNVRVGDASPTQAISLTNTAVGPAEGLNASVGTASSNLTASGSFSGLAPGSTNNSSLVVGMNTATAGSKSGTATITLASDGTFNNGTPTALAPQQVNVNGAVYRLADGSVAPNPVVINAREGTVASGAVTVSNVAATDGYSEGLRASAGGSTGAAGITGTTGLIAAGASGGGLFVSLDTSSVGAKSGTATVHYVSDGLGTSGLSPIAAGDDTISVTGGVYRAAQANTIAPNPVNLGNVRVGDALGTNFSISNVAADSGGYTETLGATVTGSTGGVTTGGSISGLASGANSNAISAGFNTATAGAKSGTATIGFTSTEVGGSGLGTIGVGSQTVSLNGAVYRMADGSVAPNPIVINAREGTVASSAVTVSNVAVADGYSEGLRASAGSSTGASGVTGTTGLIAAGASGGGLFVSLDTSSAGAKSGTATVNYASDGLGTSGLSPIAAGDNTISVTGGVYRAAQANTLPASINLGTMRTGTVVDTALSVANVAGATGGYTETLGASFGATSAGLTGSGSISGLGTGAPASNALSVQFTAGSAGAYSGNATVNFVSQEINGSGLGNLSLGGQTVNVTANVNALAALGFTNHSGFSFVETGAHSGLLDFGSWSDPAQLSAMFDLSNNVFGPADSLIGGFDLSGLSGSPFSVFGAQSFDLGGGESLPFELRFDPTGTGSFSGTFVLDLASHNDAQSDLDLGAYSFTVRGQVGSGPSVPDSPVGVVSALALLATLALGRIYNRVRTIRTTRETLT